MFEFLTNGVLVFPVPERKSSVEVSNKRTSATAHARVAGQLSALESAIHSAVAAQQAQLAHLSTGLAALTDRKERDLPALRAATADLRALFERETGRALAQVRQHVDAGAERRGEAEQRDEAAAAAAQAGLGRAVQEAGETLKALQGALDTQHKQVTAMVQQQREVRGCCQRESTTESSANGPVYSASIRRLFCFCYDARTKRSRKPLQEDQSDPSMFRRGFPFTYCLMSLLVLNMSIHSPCASVRVVLSLLIKYSQALLFVPMHQLHSGYTCRKRRCVLDRMFSFLSCLMES